MSQEIPNLPQRMKCASCNADTHSRSTSHLCPNNTGKRKGARKEEFAGLSDTMNVGIRTCSIKDGLEASMQAAQTAAFSPTAPIGIQVPAMLQRQETRARETLRRDIKNMSVVCSQAFVEVGLFDLLATNIACETPGEEVPAHDQNYYAMLFRQVFKLDKVKVRGNVLLQTLNHYRLLRGAGNQAAPPLTPHNYSSVLSSLSVMAVQNYAYDS